MKNNAIEVPEDQLEAVIGKMGMVDYNVTTPEQKAAIRVWAATLQGLCDSDFVEACVGFVDASAVANSESRPNDPAWCYSTSCQWEAKRRHVAAGHDSECRGSNLYVRGYGIACRNRGFDPGPWNACTCGFDES